MALQEIEKLRREINRLNEELVLAKSRFESIVKNSADGILVLDDKGHIVYANPATHALFGVAPQSLLGLDFGYPAVCGETTELDLPRHHGQPTVVEMRVADTEWEGRHASILSLHDVTERKKVEDALQKERDFAESLVATAHAIIAVFDLDGNIIQINPFAESLIGYPLENIKGQNWFKLFVPEHDRAEGKNIFHELTKENKTQSHISTVISANGSQYAIEWYCKTLTDTRGKIIGVLGIGIDISERLQAEFALKASEERFRGFFENSPIGIFQSSFEGKLIHINPALAKMIGYDSVKEAMDHVTNFGAQFYDKLETRKKIVAITLKSDDFQFFDLVFRKKENEKRYGKLFIRAVRDDKGRPKYIEGLIEDNTDRRIAEEELEKTINQFQRLADNVPGMIYQYLHTVDGKSEFTYISPHSKDIYELESYEIIADMDHFFQLHHPHDFHLICDIAKVSDPNSKPWNWEGRIITPSGKTKWIQGRAHPEILSNGDILWDGLVTDITERKAYEEKIKQLSTAVEQSANAIMITNAAGEIEYVNPCFERVTGYTAKEAIGQNPRILKSDLHNQEYYASIWSQILLGKNWTGEFQNKRKNGELYWESATISPIKDETGKITHFIAIKEDITHRKEAELALRESENLLSQIYKTLHTGICLTDHEYKLIEFNDALCHIFGYTRRELLGMHFFRLSSTEHVPYLKAIFESFLSGDTEMPSELYVRRKDGQKIIIKISSGVLEREDGQRFIVSSIEDITDQKLSEHALEKSEENYRRIVETASEGLWVIDEEGYITFANRRMSEMLGRSVEDIIGTPLQDLIHPDEKENLQIYFYRWKLGIEEPQDLKFRKLNGSILWGIVNTASIFDEFGKFTGALGMLTDITERKFAEEQLKSSQQKLKHHIESTPLAAIEFDMSFKIVSWNPAAEKIFGFKKEEAFGKHVRVLIPNTEWQAVYNEWTDLLQKQSGSVHTFANLTKSGKHIQCNWYSTPLIDNTGNTIGIAALAEDITEKKLAEAALIESQKSLTAIFESIDAAVISIDYNMQIVMFNKAGETIFGYTSAEIIGQSFDILLPEDSQHVHISEIIEFSQSSQTILKISDEKGLFGLRKHASSFPAEASISKLMVGGKPLMVILLNDITERKKMQEQILRAQRMESIGLLASGIAHDMNNILTPIMMSMELLKEIVDDEEGFERIQTINKSTRRAKNLIQQLLAFARGKSEQQIPVNLRRLILELTNFMKETFPRSIQLSVNIPKNLPFILGDPTQIHQVLMNLCVNAHDAMPDGGQLSISSEKISLSEAETKLHIDAKAGNYIKVIVKDTGTGIPNEHLHKIFEPFFTTKQQGKGSGLGLAMTYTIVHNHGGFITVDSEERKGTAFEIYFPLLKEEKHTELDEIEADAPEGNGEIILVVDDEKEIRDVTAKILSANGYTPFCASDGSQAVAIYVEHKESINAVILDMMMPVMDGFATIRALKNIDPNVKILCVSGLVDKESISKHSDIDDNVKAILTKPYNAENLLTTLYDTIHQ
ncbi:PAS domain S-box protein [Chloroherpeton thalassium]|nr:PAS domain S-box protein [Chloroherpeton thalassium]